LLLPQKRAVATWRVDQQGLAERLEDASRLEGGVLADGLALKEIWVV